MYILCVFCCFFFKQKTAYEMRISDWSSDVCSSDLVGIILDDREAADLVRRRTEREAPAFEADRMVVDLLLALDEQRALRLQRPTVRGRQLRLLRQPEGVEIGGADDLADRLAERGAGTSANRRPGQRRIQASLAAELRHDPARQGQDRLREQDDEDRTSVGKGKKGA